jgi:hypothetical protein
MANKSKAENLAQNCEDISILASRSGSLGGELYGAVLKSAAAELRRLAEIERLYEDLKFRMDGLEK